VLTADSIGYEDYDLGSINTQIYTNFLNIKKTPRFFIDKSEILCCKTIFLIVYL